MELRQIKGDKPDAFLERHNFFFLENAFFGQAFLGRLKKTEPSGRHQFARAFLQGKAQAAFLPGLEKFAGKPRNPVFAGPGHCGAPDIGGFSGCGSQHILPAAVAGKLARIAKLKQNPQVGPVC